MHTSVTRQFRTSGFRSQGRTKAAFRRHRARLANLHAIVVQNIKAVLREKGWEDRDLAEALNAVPSKISKWFRTTGKPQEINLNDLQRISQVLKIPVSELIFGKNSPDSSRSLPEDPSPDNAARIIAEHFGFEVRRRK